MAEELSMPGGFGGLMRYKEEYDSKFKFSPSHVILMIVVVIVFVAILKIFFPLA
jgi:preprotein translocase subunit Sec61beta